MKTIIWSCDRKRDHNGPVSHEMAIPDDGSLSSQIAIGQTRKRYLSSAGLLCDARVREKDINGKVVDVPCLGSVTETETDK